ncbi:contact-dependent growth inhibition system immunity protein [Scopulibacillus cellulosilyticus]|uniref:Contact-dependent growth inhibition system immunity protein n=1 Tax=Scopulibacillus cellulosilyticus TaxID=2665665 RepID=A0ABW2PZ19_9BACL
MIEENNFLYETENFLGANFHQDIESPEEALEEYISECNNEALQFTLDFLTDFLNDNLSNKEKEEFIEANTEIYFPAIGLTPLEWLKSVVNKINGALCEK